MTEVSKVLKSNRKYCKYLHLRMMEGRDEKLRPHLHSSMQCRISNIAEKVVYHQSLSYLDANNLLSPCQFGFRKNFSAETAATIFYGRNPPKYG